MDWQTIILYLVGILFNIGAVAAIREKAYQAGTKWLQRGHIAVILVFALCFLELLFTGKFEALRDADAFIKLIETAWLMAGTSIGLHSAKKIVVG